MDIEKRLRVVSLDILKGIVMVVMVLDHVRDFFHADAHFFDPCDPELSSPAIFFTRWITHYCAPVFVLLSGASIALIQARKGNAETRRFLLTRGLWLMFCDAVIVSFLWMFNPAFPMMILGVIWVIGLAMVLSAGVIQWSSRWLMMLAAVVLLGHNALDASEGIDSSFLYSLLHQFHPTFFGDLKVLVAYPLLPWVGIMWVGIVLGRMHLNPKPLLNAQLRKAGGLMALGFFLIRGVNLYGNAFPWMQQADFAGTAMDFLNPEKYPPSLAYCLMTLGPALILLSFLDTRTKWAEYLMVFGRVPFFFYLVHLLLIHVLAWGLSVIQGFGWDAMILDEFVTRSPKLTGYGLGLLGVYGVWISAVVALYRPSRFWMNYKKNNPEKWWLSYL